MSWMQLQVEVAAEQIEDIGDRLEAAGAVSVTMESANQQALFDHDPESSEVWDKTRVTGLFDTGVSLAGLLKQLTADSLSFNLSELAEQNWERAWMERFQPMQFADDLWICPSWLEPPDPDAINIQLDPGMAFGTGTHPTTAMCMRWLGEHRHIPVQRVIDYGCGSGILAIAAARLGAARVWCVDIETQALEACVENARKNNVEDQIVTALPEDFEAVQADLLLANILAGPLTELAERFASLLKAGGHLVISGILAEQAEQTREHYCQWFDMDMPVQQEEWVMIHGIRTNT